MILELLKYPDPLLMRKSEPIAEITPDIEALAADMLETMYAKEGLGLAAPQVGMLCRLIVVDVTGPEKRENPMVLINPEIIESEGEIIKDEGCLSVNAYRADVKRAQKVGVRALGLDGNPVEIVGEDLLAVCLQHEIDHLDGVLFIDRISRLKRSLYDAKVKKWMRKK